MVVVMILCYMCKLYHTLFLYFMLFLIFNVMLIQYIISMFCMWGVSSFLFQGYTFLFDCTSSGSYVARYIVLTYLGLLPLLTLGAHAQRGLQ